MKYIVTDHRTETIVIESTGIEVEEGVLYLFAEQGKQYAAIFAKDCWTRIEREENNRG